MKISIVTIVFNDAGHIEQTVRNVLGQTAFADVEYIVVDGASTDGTSKIIGRYRDKIDTYLCEPDTGIYNAMNKGLKMATGDYVMFLNSGDCLSGSDVIERLVAAIRGCEYSLPDVVYGCYRETNGEAGLASAIIPCRDSSKIWYGPVASHQSTVYRLAHLRQHGIAYDETYRIAADYKLTAQAIRSAQIVLKTDICISDFDTSGVSSTNQDLGLKEANRVRREVFGWGGLKLVALTSVLLGARFAKRHCGPIYRMLRHR